MMRPSHKRPANRSQDPTRQSGKKGGQAVGKSDEAEAVGYRKPPLEHSWKKGRSGNPKGRPKGAKSYKTVVKDVMEAKLGRKIPDLKQLTRLEAILLKTVQKALSGDSKAALVMLNQYNAAAADELPPEDEITEADEATYNAFITKHK